ncbi:hypothetical protein CEXT_10942 [Caerostris extrusa]|uniref:Myosin motor domain-containing protein n=1 Tax=Caerostris extrusa TaxID=172846 RepID=A0AAV4NPN3_CAEEX|nr:hypothetical protein CEXT_10942 [Caerostris extrusa]
MREGAVAHSQAASDLRQVPFSWIDCVLFLLSASDARRRTDGRPQRGSNKRNQTANIKKCSLVLRRLEETSWQHDNQNREGNFHVLYALSGHGKSVSRDVLILDLSRMIGDFELTLMRN